MEYRQFCIVIVALNSPVIFESLVDLTGTQLKFSTAYHPQTQGVVERMNFVVGQMLRCIIHENRDSSWDSLLPTVEMTIIHFQIQVLDIVLSS